VKIAIFAILRSLKLSAKGLNVGVHLFLDEIQLCPAKQYAGVLKFLGCKGMNF
jgi:hypothetical protein